MVWNVKDDKWKIIQLFLVRRKYSSRDIEIKIYKKKMVFDQCQETSGSFSSKPEHCWWTRIQVIWKRSTRRPWRSYIVTVLMLEWPIFWLKMLLDVGRSSWVFVCTSSWKHYFNTVRNVNLNVLFHVGMSKSFKSITKKNSSKENYFDLLHKSIKWKTWNLSWQPDDRPETHSNQLSTIKYPYFYLSYKLIAQTVK